jgi:hypothetical protein
MAEGMIGKRALQRVGRNELKEDGYEEGDLIIRPLIE